jgi:hypothetical protein
MLGVVGKAVLFFCVVVCMFGSRGLFFCGSGSGWLVGGLVLEERGMLICYSVLCISWMDQCFEFAIAKWTLLVFIVTV